MLKRRVPFDADRLGWTAGMKQWLGNKYVRWRYDHQGRSIFDAEWDVLVVLDACRVDTLRKISSEYDFLNDVGTFPSLAGCTWRWMEKTFKDDHRDAMAETTYVCANPFSDDYLSPDEFGELIEVWQYAWDDELGTVPPRPVTDEAIRAHREGDGDRLLVHYLQPHVPFIGSERSRSLDMGNFGVGESGVDDDWVLVQRGERGREAAIADYEDNLRLVLDDVALLAQNVDANSFVVSADHGNAVGEYGIYGHPPAVPLPALRDVPWCVLETTDRETYAPEINEHSSDSGEVKQKLRELGYLSG